MADETELERLLDEIDSGKTPEEVCRTCPELLSEVRDRYRKMKALESELDAMFPAEDAETCCSPTPNWQVGNHLPQIRGYQVEAELGRGGMGVVYRARHLRLNRVVAVKMLLAGTYAGPHEVERFQREAEAVAALQHPNIVQVYDFGDHDGLPYFSMEFIEGGTLSQRARGKPLPPRQAASIVASLADAMQAAHQGGILHRDLKPGNVLLTADGTPKIGDFGLARRLQAETSQTATGATLGTPNYMAPEQARGKMRDLGPTADVYGLGAILYELLTGRPPFRGETAMETLHQVLTQDPVPVSRRNVKVPRDLETICMKCLYKEPSRRYSSAAELAADLRCFLQGEAIAARAEGRMERLVRGLRRRPALTVGAAASVLLAAALIGGGLWANNERAAKKLANEQLEQLEKERLDRDFAARLEAIHLNRAAVVGGRYHRGPNKKRADREYEAAFREGGYGEVHDDPEAVAARVRASSIRTAIVAALDDWAYCASESDDRQRQPWLLEVAQLADMDAADTRQRLRDPAAWKDRATLTEISASALRTKPSVELLVAIGERLRDVGGDAIPFLKAVQQEHPGDFWANFSLGIALTAANDPRGASRYYQAALALQPNASAVYNSLGWALLASDQRVEAVECFERALRIDPNFALAHSNLGVVRDSQGRKDEAIEHFRQALDIDPELATAHFNLGLALFAQGKKAEAIERFERAIAIDPTYADAHNELGILLAEMDRRDEAIKHFQQAIAIDPKYGDAYRNLGTARLIAGRPDEAIEPLEQSVAIDPKLAHGYELLSQAYLGVGEFRRAQGAAQVCLKLLGDTDPSRARVSQQIRRCEHLLALEARLPGILRREDKAADAAEGLELAKVCYIKKRFAAAARLFTDTFLEKPSMADDMQAGSRYNAACVAALAGCGRGEEAGKLSEAERLEWRKQACAWLRADLALWRTKVDDAANRAWVKQTLTHWRVDPDLEGLREPSALEKLSLEECTELLTLWKEVDVLLKQADAGK